MLRAPARKTFGSVTSSDLLSDDMGMKYPGWASLQAGSRSVASSLKGEGERMGVTANECVVFPLRVLKTLFKLIAVVVTLLCKC